MASSSPSTTTTTDSRNKTVIGYPAHPSLFAAGYPPVPSPPPTAYPATDAYPYAAPPPTSFTRTYLHHSAQTHNNQQRNFLSRVLSAVIAAILVVFVVFFVVWVVLRPRIPEFAVNSASVSPLNATGSELSATWDITFLVRNPNDKLRVYYDHIETRIVYDGDYLLTGTAMPDFYQNKLNVTTVGVRLAVAAEVMDGNVLKAILGERASGSVAFDVRMLAWIRFRKGAWRTRKHLMRVSCEDVRFGFSQSSTNNSGSGSLLGRPRACKVAL